MAIKLLAAAALLSWASAAVWGAPPDTTVSETRMGYAFEVPRGCIVNHGVDGRGAQIPGWFQIDSKHGQPLVMVRTFGPSIYRAVLGDGPLSDPGDSLLSYAKAEALQLCLDSSTPDTIVSLHRHRNAHGAEVFEVFVKAYPATDYLGEEPTEDDPSAAADTVAQPPTAEGGTRAHVAGPVFVVNLSRAEARLLIEVSAWGWYSGLPAEWSEVARVISRTVRWL